MCIANVRIISIAIYILKNAANSISEHVSKFWVWPQSRSNSMLWLLSDFCDQCCVAKPVSTTHAQWLTQALIWGLGPACVCMFSHGCTYKAICFETLVTKSFVNTRQRRQCWYCINHPFYNRIPFSNSASIARQNTSVLKVTVHTYSEGFKGRAPASYENFGLKQFCTTVKQFCY